MQVFTTTLASRPVGASHVAATLQSEPEYPALHVAVVQTELDEHVSHVPLVSVGQPASQPSVTSLLSSKWFAAQISALHEGPFEQSEQVALLSTPQVEPPPQVDAPD